MSDRYRVSARTAAGEELVYELFEAQSDADKLWGELTGEGTVLEASGSPAVIVAYEELCHGQWVLASRRLLAFVRGGE